MLDEVAKETGGRRDQVVLARLLGHDPANVPLVGVSSIGRIDEVLEGVDLRLSADSTGASPPRTEDRGGTWEGPWPEGFGKRFRSRPRVEPVRTLVPGITRSAFNLGLETRVGPG